MVSAVVSDLHIGSPGGTLALPAVRSALVAELARADEAVLLGDVFSLRRRPLREVLAAAEPFLRELGQAMRGRRVVIVPGKHDHHLAGPLLEGRALAGSSLEPAVVHPASETGAVGWVAGRLSPADTHVAYPGLWLRPGVYATHGHYMDCYINVPRREAIAARAMRRTTGGPSHPARPDDYEDVLAPAYAFQHALAQSRSTGAGHVQRQNRLASRVVPIGSSLLCRAGLRAMDKVVSKLAIEAEHVVFGHTHRAGPLEGDGEWRTAGGVGLTNTGSWVKLSGSLTGLGSAPGYSPGYCAIVADSGAPRLVNVLDDTARGHDHHH